MIVQFDGIRERRQAFRSPALRHAAERLRDESGTPLLRIVQDVERPDRCYAIAGYADRAAREAHRRGPIPARAGPAVAPPLATDPVRLIPGSVPADADAG